MKVGGLKDPYCKFHCVAAVFLYPSFQYLTFQQTDTLREQCVALKPDCRSLPARRDIYMRNMQGQSRQNNKL